MARQDGVIKLTGQMGGISFYKSRTVTWSACCEKDREAMETPHHYNGTLAGTICATLLTLVANIHSEDVVKTAVIAALGAMVSFGVSLALRWMSRRMKHK